MLKSVASNQWDLCTHSTTFRSSVSRQLHLRQRHFCQVWTKQNTKFALRTAGHRKYPKSYHLKLNDTWPANKALSQCFNSGTCSNRKSFILSEAPPQFATKPWLLFTWECAKAKLEVFEVNYFSLGPRLTGLEFFFFNFIAVLRIRNQT